MKRWKALTGVAVALALVIAPLVSTTATAADATAPVGTIGELEPWTSDTNKISYWKDRYQDHAVECYSSEESTSHGSITNGGKTVTLNEFLQSWPGDHWEVLVIKGGSEKINVIWHPTAGVAYASPPNSAGIQADVSHWLVCKGATPETELLQATASVVVDPPSCLDYDGKVTITFTHAKVTSAKHNGATFSVERVFSGEYPAPPVGPYKIVLTADEGFGFGEDRAPTLTLTFTVLAPLTAEDCAEVVTPVVPTWVDECGEGNGKWTYPADTKGYHYVESTLEGAKVLELVADAGFRFPEGTVTKYTKTDSDEPCVVDYPVPALFNAPPEPPTCETAGAFSTAFLGEPDEDGWYEYDNVWVYVDRDTPGEVTIYIEAKPGYTLSELSEDWDVDEEGTFATRTIVLAAQLSGEELCPLAEVPPTPTSTATPTPAPAALPATGGVDMTPWGIGAALMLIAGAALLTTRRLARR